MHGFASPHNSCSSCHPEFLHIFTCLNTDHPSRSVLSCRILSLLPLLEMSSPSCRVKHLLSCISAGPVSLRWSGFLCRMVSSQRADKNSSTHPSLPARSSLRALHTVDTTECIMLWTASQWSLWRCRKIVYDLVNVRKPLSDFFQANHKIAGIIWYNIFLKMYVKECREMYVCPRHSFRQQDLG